MEINKLINLNSHLSYLLLVVLTTSFFLFSSCEKKDELGFTADFNYEFIDANHVKFTNASSGEYYSLTWDFGVGDPVTTTDKKEEFTIYYPQAGDINVSLKVYNYTGENKEAVKVINIEQTDLFVSFAMVYDDEKPNDVLLINTSEGEWDTFIWKYRNLEVPDETNHTAYFPFEGIYTIELLVIKDGSEFSVSQTANILDDDPEYIENLTLVWSDEFDGTSVNTNFWTFETGQHGWGNNELQNYTNGDNSEIVDGKLIITAKKVNNNTLPGSYTSSRMVSRYKEEFQYGRFEIRAKLPSGTGIWPAIWMLGSNLGEVSWPACGEIDIMEYVGYDPNIVHSTVHTTAGSGVNGSGSSMSLPTCEEEFHNYGVIWTDEKMVFYVDSMDNVIHTYNPAVKTPENWPFDQKAFFILNVAVGGNWGGVQGVDNSIFPQSLEIDYVRVYQ